MTDERSRSPDHEKELQVARKLALFRAARIGCLQQQHNQIKHQHQLLHDRHQRLEMAVAERSASVSEQVSLLNMDLPDTLNA